MDINKVKTAPDFFLIYFKSLIFLTWLPLQKVLFCAAWLTMFFHGRQKSLCMQVALSGVLIKKIALLHSELHMKLYLEFLHSPPLPHIFFS